MANRSDKTPLEEVLENIFKESGNDNTGKREEKYRDSDKEDKTEEIKSKDNEESAMSGIGLLVFVFFVVIMIFQRCSREIV